MQRRNFIQKTAIAGFSFAFLPFESCKNAATGQGETAKFSLDEITLDELQKNFQSGQMTARSVTQLYLDRIATIDKSGPTLNSIIELNPDALTIAESMDAERKAGKIRGLLHGVPVLIKDNIDTADKMQTTAGALAMEGNIASKDAFVVAQLRAAGAVILGKTNLSEWANFRSTRSTSGWSSRGGQTHNPYILDRSPCGSSSGSGAAVSANLCVIAVGTETDGSIACPASMNGLVGIKPTVGLVSRAGIIPISKTQDTAGPLSRTVRDAAILLNILRGIDPNDAATTATYNGSSNPLTQKVDYTQFLDVNALKGKRIGIEKTFLKHHEVIDGLVKKAMDTMREKGATIIEVDYMSIGRKAGDAEFKVLQYEFKDGLNKYLATANAKVKSLKEVIDFNLKNEAKAMPFFKQETLINSEKLGSLDSKEYQEAFAKCQPVVRKYLDKLMKDNKLDALCGPATGAAWCNDLVNGDAWSGYGAYGPAAIAGYPSVTVPMGNANGLPIGLSFLGKAWDEGSLIGLGYAFEQATKGRTVPKFLNAL